MNSTLFVAFCLGITTFMTWFYGEVRDHFNQPDPFLERISELKEDIKREQLKHLLTQYEFEDFRQYTATLLPKAIKTKGPGEKSYKLRGLASITQKTSSDKLQTLRAREVFENGRAAFRSKNYPEAIRSFNKVIEKHPYSAHVLESLFLKLESHFQIREFNDATRVLEKLVEVYPSAELTGYAMLRVGKIYEFQDRHDDAIRLYQTVLEAFPDRSLASVARSSLRSVEL